MLRFILLAIVLLVFAAIAVTLLLSALVFLTLACVVGIPLFFVVKPWLQRHGVAISSKREPPADRLKTLYVEGKIDLFEFERRMEHLIAVEHS